MNGARPRADGASRPSVADALGLRFRRANALQRLSWRVTTSRPGSWLFGRLLHQVDRLLARLSGGRLSVPELTAGLPVMLLTTTGARTLEPRTVPVVPAPYGRHVAVLGTSFANRRTPGWVFNLAADPRAAVSYHGRSVDVVAREVSGADWQAAWDEASAFCWGHAAYARRVPHRTIRIFVLEVADASRRGA